MPMIVCKESYASMDVPDIAHAVCSLGTGTCRLPKGAIVVGHIERKYGSEPVLHGRAFNELQGIVNYAVTRAANRKSAASLRQRQLEAEFAALVSVWHEATGLSSRLDQILLHPAYRRIISMGRSVVPLILQELTQRLDHWFWALTIITGENPGTHARSMEEMAAAWIKWGKTQGYLND